MATSVKFNVDTGQVYSETVIRAPTRQQTLWQYHVSGLPAERRRSTLGPPTLLSLALFQLVRNLDDLTPDVLRNVPGLLGEMIWKRLESSGLKSFYLWKTFASAYPDSEVPSIRYHSHRIQSVEAPLVNYLQPAMSPDWMTCLSIETCQVRTVELVNLSGCKNLEALYLMAYTADDDHHQQEHLLRSWNRVGQDEQVFPALRILILCGFAGLNARNLEFLATFPALQYFAQEHPGRYLPSMEGSNDDISVRGVTFRHIAGPIRSDPRLIYGLVCERGEMSMDDGEESTLSPARPTLHLQLGSFLRRDDALLRTPPRRLQLYQREKTTLVVDETVPRGTEMETKGDADADTATSTASVYPRPPSSANANKKRKENGRASIRSSKRRPMEDMLRGFESRGG
ncbi:MAG: hypothetical protein M1823_001544 [Watsoniomyces obsoletus]|nr:MAG: hypothetical protein M1823_001544 [Watsoniomyces obsoletus]